MNRFPPIAIVGRSCILPGVETPDALFDAVLEGRSLLTPTPQDRWRGIDPERLAQSREKGAHVASLMGGYVREVMLDVDEVAGRVPELDCLDPLFQWLAHCATACARATRSAPSRTGLVVGNLSYPSNLGAAFVEGHWRGETGIDPRNRFSSGLPVHLIAEALGFGGAAFALDAACASSLYAIKLACDALHDGHADLMVAGGVNRADDLFLHLGFTALQALSPTGASRPFHREADGLVPSEGAALIAMKRLADAERDGDRIFGVIRAVGLSNDGRQNGFLAPAAAGQARAMAQAFAQSGLAPGDIAFVDCHATGTARGDATEIESLSSCYGRTPLQLGALKSVMGHAITASGAASLIHLLAAFERGAAPPTICDAPLAAIMDAGFALPQTPTTWREGVRRAAVSNFGFGGNNAHLIVESHVRERRRKRVKPVAPSGDVVVVGLGVVAGGARGVAAFRRRAFGERIAPQPVEEVHLALAGLGFPPSDLRASLGQQTLMLEAAAEATAQIAPLPAQATGVFIGMGVDATIARHGVRLAHGADAAWREVNDAAAPALTPEGVVGAMPNIPANRINAQRDWRGPGFTVSSEELSGVTALMLAVRALRAGELDAALVGAVDLCDEPANAAALRAVLPDAAAPGDAAVAFVLKRRADALAAGEAILGVFDDGGGRASESDDAAARFGHLHAAQGLVQIASDLLALSARVRIDAVGAQPDPGVSRVRRHIPSFSGRHVTVDVAAGERRATAIAAVPVLRRYAAATHDALLARLEADAPGGEGAVRCAIVADGEQAFASLRGRAIEALKRGEAPAMPGVLFADAPVRGEIAFTFTGAAAAYPGAGRELLLAWPEVNNGLAARHAGARDLARALYGADIGVLHPRVQLTGCALVCQAHAVFAREVLGLSPHAAIGLSSGETNALLAFDVWRDLDVMLAEIEKSGLYGDELTGDCRAAARAWGLAEDRADWTCWRITAPVAAVEAALAVEPRAYMTIIQAPDDCVIGGDRAACARVVDVVGRGRAMPLGLDMVVHCAAMAPFGDAWRRIHTREAYPATGVRFYSNATNGAYVPTSQAAAEAITQQALNPIDFPATVRAAYDDGVRIFIEHGPRGILTSAIDRILEGKPHLAVALDAQERRGLRALSESLLRLWAHSVDVNVEAFETRLNELRREQEEPTADLSRTLVLPAHRPDIVAVAAKETRPAFGAASAPPQPEGLQVMPVAPQSLPALALFSFSPPSAAVRAREVVEPGTRAGAALRLISDVGETHRRFMSKQADAHAAFLQTRQSLLAAAMGGRRPVPQHPAMPPPRQVQTQKALYDRADLEVLAGGRISEVFGPLFAQQDGYARQVRMPQPPLLFADRVLSLEGEAGSMGKGRIVTETDVVGDAWYMHAGRMSPGVVIESGQADLLLASWLGADFHNRGERVYRLLGCDLTFMGELPRAGETLRYDIHIDAHAVSGETRLFFFHYDCHIGNRLMISVRNGQAGFFSAEELQQSGGVLWDAEDDPPKVDARVDAPPCVTTRRQFDRAALDAFVEGRAYACFGEGFERAAAHTRTPSLPDGRLQLLDKVSEFEPHGGPWGRGYLRARAHAPTDAWFYEGHFKNDPCMPGTLMADAATQALAFAMAAYGFTIERDGWRFEPVPGEMARFVCRGQVTPETAHDLDYEVFIEEIIDGPTPTVFAALLCRSDGFKVFHCRRFGMRLVPDWPVDIAALTSAKRIVGQSTDVRGDLGGLTACALGKPSDAFGALYAPFDGARRAPRLPADPYHFVSRILSVDGAPGVPAEGGTVVAEYDAPVGAWYFADGGGDAVPLAVLTEVLLQPCGWLASYMGFAANRANDAAFRNLDGNEVLLHRPPRAGVLRVTARLERFAEAGGSTIVFFNVVCTQGGELVMTMKTAFGFFSPAALQSQVGLPASEATRAALAQTGAALPVLDDMRRNGLHLSDGRLRLLDAITAYDCNGGVASFGRLVTRATVDPEAWFFKAHFFQDPVQPGSLGLEALQQALRIAVILRTGVEGGEFEPVGVGTPFTWRFRGQVVPNNHEVFAEVEIISFVEESDGVLAVANGSYWVDGLRIYEVKGMAARWKRGGHGSAT
ncbi:MAG: beta-ketoacyl synthase N-terminal-like domain-containing protein [Alphaproteobacteria bacterium]|nr:beta-ketoacyl synthase N-terminal-like domain-containing protein [Alphaproteobacteria bacterium]